MNGTYVLIILIGVVVMRGITKVLDELGLMILSRDIELQEKRTEIDDLKKKIEAIEEYIDFCEKQR